MDIINLKNYQDQRGSLIENTDVQVMLNSKHFFISKSKPGVIRGNHYHKNKSEWFLVVQGTAEITTIDIETKATESQIVKDIDHILVNMKPNVAHAIKNIGPNEMILLALINEQFDHDNPDTYQYIVT